MLVLSFSSKLDWGSYIIRIGKASSKKIGALSCSMKLLSPEVAFYVYKSTICPCMEYYCHVWAGAPSCYSELLGKVQRQICRTVLDLHLLVLFNPWIKDGYVSSFFPRTARLWNSLSIECFPLTYDLSGFKSGINRHLLIAGAF